MGCRSKPRFQALKAGGVLVLLLALLSGQTPAIHASQTGLEGTPPESCFLKNVELLKLLGKSPMSGIQMSTTHQTSRVREQTLFLHGSISTVQRERIARKIREMNDFLGTHFETPKQITYVAPEFSLSPEALTSSEFPEIYSPIHMGAPGDSIHPVASRATAEHEYGHLVFVETLNKILQSGGSSIHFPYLRMREAQRSFAIADLKKQVLDLQYQRAREAADWDSIASLSSEIGTVLRERDSALSLLVDFRKKIGQKDLEIESFEELFADLISIAKRHDPKAIRRAAEFSPDQIKKFKDQGLLKADLVVDPALRDASIYKNPVGWLSDVPTEDLDLHSVLAPTTHFIWDRYLRKTKTPAERVRILRGAFDEMVREIENQWVTETLGQLTPEELNIRLIDRLKTLSLGR